MYDIISLDSKELNELREIGRQLNIPKVDKLEKQDLIYKILDHQALNPTPEILSKEKQEQAKPFRGRPRKDLNETPREPREATLPNIPREPRSSEPSAEKKEIKDSSEPAQPREPRQQLITRVEELPPLHPVRPDLQHLVQVG